MCWPPNHLFGIFGSYYICTWCTYTQLSRTKPCSSNISFTTTPIMHNWNVNCHFLAIPIIAVLHLRFDTVEINCYWNILGWNDRAIQVKFKRLSIYIWNLFQQIRFKKKNLTLPIPWNLSSHFYRRTPPYVTLDLM